MDGAAPCRFFQSPNGCFRGELCSFRHETADASAENNASGAIVSHSIGARPCRFFSTGMGCRNGSACPFVHVSAAPVPAPMYGNAMEDPVAGDYSATGPMAVNSGGTVFFNHPGMPPPMMMVVPEQAAMQEAPAAENPADQASTPTTGRRRLKIEPNPSKKNHEVISEILPVFTRDIEGPVRGARSLTRWLPSRPL